METTYKTQFTVRTTEVDCHNRLKWNILLNYLQEAAGGHCEELELDWKHLHPMGLFWAVIRYRLQITRLPGAGEKITVETWAMPTTRTAYPRSAVAYDEKGNELFRSVSLWVLMDLSSRAMVLPGKSGVEVPGLVRGDELATPNSLVVRTLSSGCSRGVGFTDLDLNGHMNNCRYLDWVQDLLPAAFFRENPPKLIQVCYLSEAREGDRVDMTWEMNAQRELTVEAHRDAPEGNTATRVFTAKVQF